MATNFPTSLDTFVNPVGTDNLATINHASQHDNINDAVAALEAKVGINGSAATTSLDYKVNHAPSGFPRTQGSSFAIMDPLNAISASAPNSANMNLAYFVAPISMSTTQVRMIVTGTASGSASLGLYSVDASDNGTRLVTASLATTVAGAITASWSASQAIVAGNRYAIGLNTSAGATFAAHLPGTQQTVEFGTLPRLSGQYAAQSIPASFTAGNITNIASFFYAVLL